MWISPHWRKEVFKFQNAVAIYAIRNGINKAQLVFQRHFTWISYWKRKYEDKNFHSGNWGETQFHKWTKDEIFQMWEILWNKCKNTPTSTIPEYFFLL